MNYLKKELEKRFSSFENLELLPQNFQDTWQWFNKQQELLSKDYADAAQAVKGIIVARALAVLEGKEVKLSDYRQWQWDKALSEQFYQMKNNLNRNREQGRIANTESWTILSENMLTKAVRLIPENPAQALYLFKVYNDEVRGTRDCRPLKTFLVQNFAEKAADLLDVTDEELESNQLDLTKEVWKRIANKKDTRNPHIAQVASAALVNDGLPF